MNLQSFKRKVEYTFLLRIEFLVSKSCHVNFYQSFTNKLTAENKYRSKLGYSEKDHLFTADKFVGKFSEKIAKVYLFHLNTK